MAYIQLVDESQARGELASAYRRVGPIVESAYGARLVPDVFRAPSLVPAYANFLSEQLRLMTDDGNVYLASADATVPRFLVAFMTALYSECFH